MPVPNSEQYFSMLDNARKHKFAFPAINVTSVVTANAALAAFAESKSDGIIQLSLGGAKFASGSAVSDPVKGAISIARHVHYMAKDLGVYVALHTDHCQAHELDWVRDLISESERCVQEGLPVLFNGHMFDGSALPLKENIDTAIPLLERCKKVGIVLEVEAGIVGGEEEGAAKTDDLSKMYTSPEDMLYVADQLYPIGGRFMFAATFGNVHGIYKPGNVKLEPGILKDGQKAVVEKYGSERSFDLVFHGGSGTAVEQIHESLEYGIVKMNVDTATQFAFSRPIADHMHENYDLVIQADGDGSKKFYDPRSYLKKAEASMKERIIQASTELKSLGKSILA